MVMWVRAMDLYARVFRTVEPKKKRYVLIIKTECHSQCYIPNVSLYYSTPNLIINQCCDSQ